MVEKLNIATDFFAEAAFDVTQLLACILVYSMMGCSSLWIKVHAAHVSTKQILCLAPFLGR